MWCIVFCNGDESNEGVWVFVVGGGLDNGGMGVVLSSVVYNRYVVLIGIEWNIDMKLFFEIDYEVMYCLGECVVKWSGFR